jgi:hypothetical protein
MQRQLFQRHAMPEVLIATSGPDSSAQALFPVVQVERLELLPF